MAAPDANVVIEDLKVLTALANNYTAKANPIPLIAAFGAPNGQVLLDGTNALVRKFVDVYQYLQDNPGAFAKTDETAVLLAYTTYVQAQKGFLSVAIRKRNLPSVLQTRGAIGSALKALFDIADEYGFSLEEATPGQANEVETEATASQKDLVSAVRAYSTYPGKP